MDTNILLHHGTDIFYNILSHLKYCDLQKLCNGVNKDMTRICQTSRFETLLNEKYKDYKKEILMDFILFTLPISYCCSIINKYNEIDEYIVYYNIYEKAILIENLKNIKYTTLPIDEFKVLLNDFIDNFNFEIYCIDLCSIKLTYLNFNTLKGIKVVLTNEPGQVYYDMTIDSKEFIESNIF